MSLPRPLARRVGKQSYNIPGSAKRRLRSYSRRVYFWQQNTSRRQRSTRARESPVIFPGCARVLAAYLHVCGVAQWLGRRSLAGGLSLIYT